MIVRTIDTVTEHLEIQNSIKFSRFAAHVEDIEINKILPLLGTELYTALDDYIEAGTDDSPEFNALIKKLQGAIVYLTYDECFDLFNVKISSSGFVRIDGESTKSIYVGQERRLRKMFHTKGNNRLDDVLKYLEENTASFPEWTGIGYRDVFVFRTIDFDKIYDIRDSRLVFLSTLPLQRVAQEKRLRDVLGDALFDALLAEVEGDSLTDANKLLLQHVQRAGAWWAVVEGGVPFQERVLEKQYSVAGSAQSYDQRDDFSAYDANMFATLLDSAEKNAEFWTSRLRKFLAANAEAYGYDADSVSSKWDISGDELEKTTII